MEHGLLVDEAINDVEFIRRGPPDLDAGGDRHVDRREVAHRDDVGTTEPERHPRRLDRRITERHVDDVIDHADVEGAAGELAEEGGIDPTDVGPVGDGVAMDEMRRRPLRRVAGHRRGRVGRCLERGEEADELAMFVDRAHAVTERERAFDEVGGQRRILVGRGEEREDLALSGMPRGEQHPRRATVRACQPDDVNHRSAAPPSECLRRR